MIKVIAELHGRSLALKLNNEEKFIEVMKQVHGIGYFEDKPLSAYKDFVNSSFKMVGEQLAAIEGQTGELKKAAKYFEDQENNIFDKCVSILRGTLNNRYHVLNHGDCGIPNLLFKYDHHERVIEARLVDYQCIRHHSVALDIHYLIYSFCDADSIANSYDQLLQIYHEKFLNVLKGSEVSINHIDQLSLNWLKSEMTRYSLFGLLYHITTMDKTIREGNNKIDKNDLLNK